MDTSFSLTEALERFLTAKRSDGLRPKTLSDYRAHIRLFLRSLPPERSVGTVAASDLDRFMADERARLAAINEARAVEMGLPLTKRNCEANPYTMLARHTALAIFFGWLEDDDELGNPPSPFRNNRGKKRK